MATAVREARQPIGDDVLRDVLRRAVFQMDHSLTIRAVQLQRGVVTGAVATAVALVAIGWRPDGGTHAPTSAA